LVNKRVLNHLLDVKEPRATGDAHYERVKR